MTTLKNQFEALKQANSDWKNENFSLFGIINYIAKRYDSDISLQVALPHLKGLKRDEIKAIITIQYLKTALTDKGLYHWTKDGEGKRTIKGEERKLFTFFTVVRMIQKYEKGNK